MSHEADETALPEEAGDIELSPDDPDFAYVAIARALDGSQGKKREELTRNMMVEYGISRATAFRWRNRGRELLKAARLNGAANAPLRVPRRQRVERGHVEVIQAEVEKTVAQAEEELTPPLEPGAKPPPKTKRPRTGPRPGKTRPEEFKAAPMELPEPHAVVLQDMMPEAAFPSTQRLAKRLIANVIETEALTKKLERLLSAALSLPAADDVEGQNLKANALNTLLAGRNDSVASHLAAYRALVAFTHAGTTDIWKILESKKLLADERDASLIGASVNGGTVAMTANVQAGPPLPDMRSLPTESLDKLYAAAMVLDSSRPRPAVVLPPGDAVLEGDAEAA